MRRSWNFVLGVPASGQRFADALGCVSTEEYVRSVLVLHQGVLGGLEGQVQALRAKFDPSTGEELEDHTEPGDYATTGYRFTVGEESWELQREANFEGEQAAGDLAKALGVHADRDFNEAMVQLKCSLDRWGGQFFVRPFVKDDTVVGLLCHFDHLVRGTPKEPDQTLDELAQDASDGPPPPDYPSLSDQAPSEAGEEEADSQPELQEAEVT